jgi:hypothetical protein
MKMLRVVHLALVTPAWNTDRAVWYINQSLSLPARIAENILPHNDKNEIRP